MGALQTLYEVHFIPYLEQPHQNIFMSTPSQKKHGGIWSRSNLLIMQVKACIFPSEITSSFILEPTEIFF